MNELVQVFLDALVPICLVIFVGYEAAKRNWSLSQVAVYRLLPALSFLAMMKVRPTADFFWLVAFAWIIGITQWITGWGVSRGMALDKITQSGFILSIIGVNAGNYGISLNKFAFGPEAIASATVYYVAWCVFFQMAGVFIASNGSRSLKDSLREVATMPLLYASFAGLGMNYWHVVVPGFVLRGVELLAGAAIPVMLVALGMGLKEVKLSRAWVRPLGVAVSLKLLAGPAFAVALSWLMGLEGLTRDIAIISSSAPTAVQAGIFAKLYESRPDFVSSAILISTVGSILTLTLLIVLLPYLDGLPHFRFAFLMP